MNICSLMSQQAIAIVWNSRALGEGTHSSLLVTQNVIVSCPFIKTLWELGAASPLGA